MPGPTESTKSISSTEPTEPTEPKEPSDVPPTPKRHVPLYTDEETVHKQSRCRARVEVATPRIKPKRITLQELKSALDADPSILDPPVAPSS